MRQAIKITSLTWSWVHARLILRSWSFRPKKVNSKLDLKERVKQKSMPCWQKLWVFLDLWSLLPRWVLRTGRSKDSKQLRTKWSLSCKTHVVLERLFSFRWIQLIMWMFTSVSKEAGTMVLPCLSFWTLLNFQKESPWVLWECRSLTSSKKSETCTFMERSNQARLSKTKPLQYCRRELKLLSRKSSMLRTKDFHLQWLDKTLRWKWKVLIKLIPKEDKLFATIWTIAKKLTNSRRQLMYWKFLKARSSCHQDMNVSCTCMPLLSRLKFSRLKPN